MTEGTYPRARDGGNSDAPIGAPVDLDALELNYGTGADIRLDKWARSDMRALIAELRATRMERDLAVQRLEEACCCATLSDRAERAEARAERAEAAEKSWRRTATERWNLLTAQSGDHTRMVLAEARAERAEAALREAIDYAEPLDLDALEMSMHWIPVLGTVSPCGCRACVNGRALISELREERSQHIATLAKLEETRAELGRMIRVADEAAERAEAAIAALDGDQ